jgi:hypothetical protein
MSKTTAQCPHCGEFLSEGEGHYCESTEVQYSPEWVQERYEHARGDA